MNKQILIFTVLATAHAVIYEPTWESLDSRPLPEWFDEAKFGIFLHWGVYAVPGFGSEWFWNTWKGGSFEHVQFMKNNYPPEFTYQEFGKEFTAEFYNPVDWVNLFKNSGAKYVVLTSKHHEGYTLWPSTRTFSWNSLDVGSHRDLLGDLADAIRSSTDLKFGVYHSLFEWYNPMWMDDKANNFTTDLFVQNKAIPDLKELINRYKPEIIWSDGEWEAPQAYWKSKEFLAWLYNDSPVKDTVVTNDRWGSDDVRCKHGGFFSCDDKFNPGVLQEHKWENAMTVDRHSWGYRRNAKIEDILSIHELLVTMAQTVSCGGNLLVNVGPTKDGMIAPIYQQRLLQMGKWLTVNGEAIYSSKPWTYQKDNWTGRTWYTSKSSTVYAIVLDWPKNNNLHLEKVVDLFQSNKVSVSLLGNDEELDWNILSDKVEITFPNRARVTSQWVWVLKIKY